MQTITLYSFIPEIFLAVCALAHVLINASLIMDYSIKSRVTLFENLAQTFFILSLTILLVFNTEIEGFFSNFLFSSTKGGSLVKIFSLIVSLWILVPVYQNFKLQRLSFYEYFSLYLFVNLSLLLLISATDMVSTYLTLELQALSFYIMASFKRHSAFASEAGLKYFILGSVFSGCFLFGCSLFYGLFGTLNFHHLSLIFFEPTSLEYFKDINFLLILGLVLITSTFLFKLAVFPFHFWAPDVYDGVPISSTIIFSILPKLGVIYFFIKWLCIVNITFIDLNYILLFCGLSSLLVGSLFALVQTRIKKLIIYSSIAQIGYIILALSQITVTSISSIYFFLCIYLITLILLWNILSVFFNNNQKLSEFNGKEISGMYLSTLQGLNSRHFIWAVVLSIAFFSISGIPPLSGFLAKVLILVSLLEQNAYVCVSFVVLISLLTVFYYLRLIKIIFFEPIKINTNKNSAQSILKSKLLLVNTHLSAFLVLLLVILFFQPNSLLLLCNLIALSI